MLDSEAGTTGSSPGQSCKRWAAPLLRISALVPTGGLAPPFAPDQREMLAFLMATTRTCDEKTSSAPSFEPWANLEESRVQTQRQRIATYCTVERLCLAQV